MTAQPSDLSPATYRCPACGGSDFKVWKLPHLIVLHWVLNPGAAVNELLLGQRLPKVIIICKGCASTQSYGVRISQSYVPCPSCHAVLSPKLENNRKAFCHWRGVECPECHRAIPCLWNVFSLLILAVTYPLWALPYHFYFKHRPRVKQARVEDVVLPEVIKPATWVYAGLFYALAMWIMMAGVPYLRSARTPGDARKLWGGLVGWSVAGGGYGAAMWLAMGRSGKRESA